MLYYSMPALAACLLYTSYLREHMDLPYEKNIKCSNYVGAVSYTHLGLPMYLVKLNPGKIPYRHDQIIYIKEFLKNDLTLLS